MRRLIVSLLLVLPLLAMAENKENRENNRHELRIGIGDALLGQLGFSGFYYEPAMEGDVPPAPLDGTPTEELHNQLIHQNKSYDPQRLLPHFFLGYQYRFNSWFGLGFQMDMTGITQKGIIRDGYGQTFGTCKQNSFQMALIPEVRFTYFHREHVNLYSAVGLGVAMDLTNVPDYGMESEWSPALSGTLLGVTWGGEHWFGAAELGYLFEPPMGVLAHKLLSLSFGYRF